MKFVAAFIVMVTGAVTFQLGILYGKTTTPIQEYQIRLESDSAYIYDGSRLVGSCNHGKDGIDSVIVLDNL